MPFFFLAGLSLLLLQPILLFAGEMTADEIQRDPYGQIKAKGHVHFTSQGVDIHAESLSFDVDSQAANLEAAKVELKGGHKLSGSHLQRIDLETFRGEGIEYTLCPDDDGGWKIVASSAYLNHDAGEFTARDARFVWGGVPIFYTPYWSHALYRNSGLLTPNFSNSTRRGTQINMPLYWAASPNWDMTFTPRWMSLRGTMADVEWRHRSRIGEETLQVQSLKDRETGEQRGRVRTDMGWQFAPTLDAAINIDAVNDGFYIADFPFYDGDRESASYLTSNASLTWRDGSDSAIFNTRYQQVLGGASNASTLQVLPRLQTRNYFDIIEDDTFKLEHQSTLFQRDVGVSGLRIGLRPSWSVPWETQGGAVSTVWGMQGQVVGYDSKNFTQRASHYSALATSLQMQAKFEKVFADQQWRHEIKPIIRFDVSSAPDQSFQPRYDSSLLPLTLSNLMQGNRYSGWDRFERMRKVSLLFVSTLQSKDDGQVRTVLETTLGMAYDGLRETVDAATGAAPTRASSNLLVEMGWMPHKKWRFSLGGQYHQPTNLWAEAHGGVRWSGQGQYFNMSWRQTDASYSLAAESVTLAAKVKLNQRWSTNTSNQYDMLRKHVIQTRLGVAYSHACWDLSLEGFKAYQVGTNSLTDIGWRLLLTFDGLGSFGDK